MEKILLSTGYFFRILLYVISLQYQTLGMCLKAGGNIYLSTNDRTEVQHDLPNY